MKDLILTLFQNLGQKLTMLLLLGTTAVTTGAAVTKVLQKPKEVDAKDSVSQDSRGRVEGMSTTPTPEVIDKVVTEIETVTPTPTIKPSPTVTPTQTAGVTPGLTPTVTTGPNTPKISSDDRDGEEKEDLHDDSTEREDQEHSDRYTNTQNDQTQGQNVKE